MALVAPYSLQVEATLEAIRDVESDAVPMLAEVGTAHRLQGRECDVVVVVDLVEGDNGTPGRLGTATHMSADDFVRSGTRPFNVGITRARRRLYLLTGLRALRSRKAGPVARAILSMIADGRIRTMTGADLLGIASSPAPEDAPSIRSRRAD